MSIENKRLVAILCTIGILLLVPFIAMQFNTGVDWNLFDFIVAGILLLSSGLACELVLRKVKTTRQRLLFCGIILLMLFLTWAELAVGIFGSPFAGS